jgi:molybdenum cofactor synthesis domain-containing protein
MSYSVGIIIVSDRAYSGERDDKCIEVFEKMLNDKFEISNTHIVNDDPEMIELALKEFVKKNLQLIFTSGGTGCSPRDNTPEASSKIIEKPIPGIDEAIRNFSSGKSPNAIYSRAMSGIADQSLIINLPGSPKAVGEILEFLLPTIEHPLKLMANEIKDCQELTENK